MSRLKVKQMKTMFLSIFFYLNIFFVNYCYSQNDIANVVLNWQEKTLVSLNNQLDTVKNDKEKYHLENRKQVHLTLSENSLRKKFLSYVFSNDLIHKRCKEFYVVETVDEGEFTVYRNYILTKLNSEKYKVICCYMYGRKEWNVEKKVNLKISGDIMNYFKKAELLKGKNTRDVIISKFIDNNIVSSDFFLFTTIKEVLPFIKTFAK